MSSEGFTSRGTYFLHAPIFLLNVTVLVLAAYALAMQEWLYTDGYGVIGPCTLVGLQAAITIYTIVLLVLTYFGIRVGPLARILVDSLFLFPTYVAGAVIIGYFNLGTSGSCYRDNLNNHLAGVPNCSYLWRSVGRAEYACVALNAIALILVITDFSMSIVHRKNRVPERKAMALNDV